MYKVGYINNRGQSTTTGTGTYRSSLFKSIKMIDDRYPVDVKEIIHQNKIEKIYSSLSGKLKKYDLVHFEPGMHWYVGSIIDELLGLKGYNKAITVHGVTGLYKPELVNRKEKFRVKYVLKNLLKKVDAVFAVSNSAKELISYYLDVDEEKIFVTYNGSKFQSYEGVSKLNIGDYVLHVSSTPRDERKSPELLLSSFKRFTEKNDTRKLVIVGGGWDSKYGRNLISQFGLADRVVCTGRISEDDLASYYRHAEVYLQTSIYEDFCLPIVEAMTFGVPVVSTEAYAIPEVAGEAALLVDRDPNLIAERLELITNDDALYKKLSEKGRQRSKRYTWERTAERTIETYIEIIKRKEYSR